MQLSLIALLVFVIGVIMWHRDKDHAARKELWKACMWIGLAFLVHGVTNWHAVVLK